MTSVIRFLALAALVFGGFSTTAFAQTSTVIPDTEAAKHVGQQVTVEGVVAKVFTSKNGNTFLNFGARYPAQTFTGWIPANTPLASDPSLQSFQGKKIKITGTIQLYRGRLKIRLRSPGT